MELRKHLFHAGYHIRIEIPSVPRLATSQLKDLMIELLWPFVFALCSIVKRGKRDTQTHVLLGSIFLFYFICYYGSVSYFLSWSNWTEEPKTDSRPIKEDTFILRQTVTSCELYLITITFLSSGLQSPEIFAHRGVVTFHANAAFYAWRSPAGYTGNSLPVG